jgi:membrane-bound serine protease (ClpP class)
MARSVHRHPYSRRQASRFQVRAGILALFALLVGVFGLLLFLLIGLLQGSAGAITPQSLLHNPNALFLLFVTAAICLYLELSHPGVLLPGVLGVLALGLFVFGALALSLNWAGFLLMLLAILLLAVDVRMPTHGVLTVGGLLSLVAGSLIFFNSGATTGGPTVSPVLIWSVAAGMGFVALMVIRYAVRSQHGRTTAGGDGLIGQTAVVLEPLAPVGRVRVLGEIWVAELDEVNKGIGIRADVASSVRVVARDGLKLIVEPLSYD